MTKKLTKDEKWVKNLTEKGKEYLSTITEYYPKEEDSIEEILKLRIQYAINDQLNHMSSSVPEFYNAETDKVDTDKIKKIVIRDITDYINEEFIESYYS